MPYVEVGRVYGYVPGSRKSSGGGEAGGGCLAVIVMFFVFCAMMKGCGF